MASQRSLKWLRNKVEAMRSFGGSLLGYVGVPGECICVGSGAEHLIDFVAFRPKMDAAQVYEGLLERGVVVKTLAVCLLLDAA
ncbi:MAG: hypothetical protein QXK18_04885 [Candidatus Bathyarchaeia archaeon]